VGLTVIGLFLGTWLALEGAIFADTTSAGREASQTADMSGSGEVSISMTSGELKVLPGAAGQVSVDERDSVRAPTRSLARRALDRVHTRISPQGSGVQIDTETDSEWFMSVQTERKLTVHVPVGANVRVEASAGEIEIAGVQGDVNVSNAAGKVTVRDVDVAGVVTVRQASGAVSFSGTLNGGRVDLRTVNGPIFASIPAATNAHVDASTVNGPIAIDQRLAVHTVRTPGSRQEASGEIGSGGPASISLNTVSGPIFLHAR
jgi:DUF4097 and DUF4098 domain-containing protein YvlB